MTDTNFYDPSFRAIPLTPVVTPVAEPSGKMSFDHAPEPIEHPALPRFGDREYLRRMRKMLELNLFPSGNRAQHRAYAGKLRLV